MIDAQYMMFMLAKNEMTGFNMIFITIICLFIKKINYYVRYFEELIINKNPYSLWPKGLLPHNKLDLVITQILF